MIPEDLRYTAEHEWIGRSADSAGRYRVGLTEFAQSSLGDIVFVQLPEPGTDVAAGAVMAEVESTKSVSEVYAPVAATVAARNDALVDQPELINRDPYGAGWLVELDLAGGSAAELPGDLLDAAAYRELTDRA